VVSFALAAKTMCGHEGEEERERKVRARREEECPIVGSEADLEVRRLQHGRWVSNLGPNRAEASCWEPGTDPLL
jgi:hypothetical protein